jgi:hypothetical protein
MEDSLPIILMVLIILSLFRHKARHLLLSF